jgi:hypothetical protein
VDIGTSITDGITAMAAIDWPGAITALDEGGLPASGGERRVLRRAASLADGIPVDLRDAFTGMDTANIGRAVRVMLHASGRRPGRHALAHQPHAQHIAQSWESMPEWLLSPVVDITLHLR